MGITFTAYTLECFFKKTYPGYEWSVNFGTELNDPTELNMLAYGRVHSFNPSDRCTIKFAAIKVNSYEFRDGNYIVDADAAEKIINTVQHNVSVWEKKKEAIRSLARFRNAAEIKPEDYSV